MPFQKRPSKLSREFAAKHGLSENLNEWTEEHHGQFQAFKKQKDKQRQEQHYEKRKENGTAPAYKPTQNLSPEEQERRRKLTANSVALNYAIKQKFREVAVSLGIGVAPRIVDDKTTILRANLARKLSPEEINAIEEDVKKTLGAKPCKRKAPDEDGYRKPGPARNADGNQDPETKRRRAMGRESSGRSRAKLKALYDKAQEYSAMAPISHYDNNNINQLRSILRNHIDDDQINEIERQAAEEYDKSMQDETPRLEPMSRSLDLLDQFFEMYPDIPVVNKVGLLAHDDHLTYLRWKRSLDPERFRERDRAYEASHRDQRAEKRRQCRLENPEAVRAVERRYAESEKGKATRASYSRMYEQLDEVKQMRKEWSRANREKVLEHSRAYRERNLNKERARVLRQDAKRMGVDIELTDDEQAQIRASPCGYCGDTSETIHITRNKIDEGFTSTNTTPACKPCALSKLRFNREDFLLAMANVAATELHDEEWEYDYEYKGAFAYTVPSSYDQYLKNANAKGREFSLTDKQYKDLIQGSCFYCLYDASDVGIDRVDNNVGYVIENVVGACSRCNEMKSNKSAENFISTAIKIYNHIFKK